MATTKEEFQTMHREWTRLEFSQEERFERQRELEEAMEKSGWRWDDDGEDVVATPVPSRE